MILSRIGVDLTAGAIRGRSMRVIDVVTAEMEKYEPGEYTQAVMESVRILRDQSNPYCSFNYLKMFIYFFYVFSYAEFR